MLETTSSRNQYTGNGAVSNYDYDFKIFVRTHLAVIVRDTDDDPVDLVIDTDYTVNGVGDEDGGSITLVSSGQAWLTAGKLKSGYKLSIRRVVVIKQQDDYANEEDFFPENHEHTYDYLTMIDQMQQDDIDRSLKLDPSLDPDDFDMQLPANIADNADAVLAVNPAGDAFVFGPSIGLIAAAEGFADDALAAQAAAEAAQAAADAALADALAAQAAAEAAADAAAASAAAAEAAAGTWNEHTVLEGQAATDLAAETIDAALYTSAFYSYEIIRGTTVFSNGWFALQYINSVWRISNGADMGDLSGVTFSVSQVSTTVQLKAALDAGAGNGTIKVSRNLVPV